MSPSRLSSNNLACNFEKITVDEATTDKVNVEPTANDDDDDAGDFSTQFKVPNGDATQVWKVPEKGKVGDVKTILKMLSGESM
ncbi:hypothetical protein VNO80_17639 [Phaseolus coccineus]|uniref:Uncharacterized protein n=1 Tax=Phaseolus coccineus TaxID=3886 RepID=A0AAN9QVQ6_PHACN